MQPLALTLLWFSTFAGASEDTSTQTSLNTTPLAISLDVSLLARQSAAITRAPYWQISLTGDLRLFDFGGIVLGYHGAFRHSGTKVVGSWSTVHRGSLGVFVDTSVNLLHLSVELGFCGFYETNQFYASGKRDTIVGTFGFGGILQGTAGIFVTNKLEFNLTMGTFQRQRAMDPFVGVGARYLL